jgi:erythronate-4-phosphate dehydrogenase
LKIVVDENIPGASAYFGQFGEVLTRNGRLLCSEDVNDADALIVRSVTRVNKALLNGSAVKFVGSTTIGSDHLDMDYLRAQNIRFCTAPGSNAESVVDYVLSGICRLDGLLETLLEGGRVGSVGYGNVGKCLGRRLTAIGIPWIAYDPLLDREAFSCLRSLDEVVCSNLLSLHAPLTVSGAFPSLHMLNAMLLQKMPVDGVLLSAGRGEVVVSSELHCLLDNRPDIRLALDVWEGEPEFSVAIAERCAINTPHIAGYSVDGKLTGLRMVAAELADFLGQTMALIDDKSLTSPIIHCGAETVPRVIREAVLAVYDVAEDSRRFSEIIHCAERGREFDMLRKYYPPRRELAYCDFRVDKPEMTSLLRALQGGK